MEYNESHDLVRTGLRADSDTTDGESEEYLDQSHF